MRPTKQLFSNFLAATAGLLLVAAIVVSFALSADGKDYRGKKVLFINSYHTGYLWSDGVTRGVVEGLKGTGVELKIHLMDTKRNKSEAFKQEAGQQVRAVIDTFKPDVVIASDDNASQYVIVPYFKESGVPFVFCGLNWDASRYGFPWRNVSGMVEVNGIKELLVHLKKFARGARIAYLGENTTSDQKEVGYYKTVFQLDVVAKHVSTFPAWKEAYLAFQDEADILIMGNIASLPDWNREEAIAFVMENSKIPSGAVKEEPMSYTLLGYAKVPEEQGHWSAQAALKILDGASPRDIPITRNKQGKLMINARLAERLNLDISYDIIQAADKIIE